MKTANELREINKNRVIDQVCYVTDDYRRTMEYFTEKLNMGPWTIIRNTNVSAFNVKCDGKAIEEPWDFFIAFTSVGNMHIEIIQPVSGPNPYSEFLKTRGPGIHHIKESIYSSDDDLRKFIDKMVENGLVVNYEGCYENDIYYYLDTYKHLGAYYEVGNSPFVENHPQLVGYYPEK